MSWLLVLGGAYLFVGCGALAFILESRDEETFPTPTAWQCIAFVLVAPTLIAYSVLRGERV
jgi:hypothetical protein